MSLFSKPQPRTFCKGKRSGALPVPNYLKGCFTNGLSSGHSPFGPSSCWLEKLWEQFSWKRAVNLWLHVSERKKGREQYFSLTTMAMGLWTAMASDRERSRFRDSCYINRLEPFHLLCSEG